MKTHTIDKGILFERALVDWIAEQIERAGSGINHSQAAQAVFGGSSPAANWRKIRIGHKWESGKAGRLTLEAAYRFIVTIGEDPGKVFLMIAEKVRQSPQF